MKLLEKYESAGFEKSIKVLRIYMYNVLVACVLLEDISLIT